MSRNYRALPSVTAKAFDRNENCYFVQFRLQKCSQHSFQKDFILPFFWWGKHLGRRNKLIIVYRLILGNYHFLRKSAKLIEYKFFLLLKIIETSFQTYVISKLEILVPTIIVKKRVMNQGIRHIRENTLLWLYFSCTHFCQKKRFSDFVTSALYSISEEHEKAWKQIMTLFSKKYQWFELIFERFRIYMQIVSNREIFLAHFIWNDLFKKNIRKRYFVTIDQFCQVDVYAYHKN